MQLPLFHIPLFSENSTTFRKLSQLFTKILILSAKISMTFLVVRLDFVITPYFRKDATFPFVSEHLLFPLFC